MHAVVVVWGEFPQERHDENKVTYLRSDQLVTWLNELPAWLNGPARAAVTQALREVRMTLGANV